jgi:hypothetical protein
MAINIITWVTPAIVAAILLAYNVDSVVFNNLYILIAESSIELGMCAMCPALYAIRWAKLVHSIIKLDPK